MFPSMDSLVICEEGHSRRAFKVTSSERRGKAGGGSFVVFGESDDRERRKVAIKAVLRSDGGAETAAHEVDVYRHCAGSKHVCSLIAVAPEVQGLGEDGVTAGLYYCLVLERGKHTLREHIDLLSKRRECNGNQARILAQLVLKVVTDVHALDVVLADLKPENLMMMDDVVSLTMKVIDLDNAVRLRIDGAYLLGYTAGYAPPGRGEEQRAHVAKPSQVAGRVGGRHDRARAVQRRPAVFPGGVGSGRGPCAG